MGAPRVWTPPFSFRVELKLGKAGTHLTQGPEPSTEPAPRRCSILLRRMHEQMKGVGCLLHRSAYVVNMDLPRWGAEALSMRINWGASDPIVSPETGVRVSGAISRVG